MGDKRMKAANIPGALLTRPHSRLHPYLISHHHISTCSSSHGHIWQKVSDLMCITKKNMGTIDRNYSIQMKVSDMTLVVMALTNA